MNVTIDHNLAKNIFKMSIKEVMQNGWTPSSAHTDDIKAIILGTHKTYRYILINGLLAKATNNYCNPLALQAGSKLKGAYDARSLCHSVVVPLERELLEDRLGGSNEPFLNKPARFTEISKNNAVRRGNDALTLELLIKVLSETTSSELAIISLKDCIHWVFKRPSRNPNDYFNNENEQFLPSSLQKFAMDFIRKSLEGETCALLSGVSFNIISVSSNKNYTIKTHKINQAGSSSKEVSDIDVYDGNLLVYCAEVKDKIFTKEDVSHAIGKVVQAKHHSLIFLKGPRASLKNGDENELQQEWVKKGFNLYFIEVIDFFYSFLSIAGKIEKNIFISWIYEHANLAKVKDNTFFHLKKCLEEIYCY